jgi:hypothetical protein
MGFEELLQEVIHVISDLFLVVVKAQPVGEACASGLVDVEQVRLGVPREWVVNGGVTAGIDTAWTILSKKSHFA